MCFKVICLSESFFGEVNRNENFSKLKTLKIAVNLKSKK